MFNLILLNHKLATVSSLGTSLCQQQVIQTLRVSLACEGGGEEVVLLAIAQISCKSVLWSVPALQPQLPHPIDRRMDCNDSPRPHAQNYAPRAHTQLMRSAEKSQAFSLFALWRCKSWHVIVMTDRGSFIGNEACQGAGFNCDIVYSKVYEGLKRGRVSQVEEFVLSISWWHLCWSNRLHVFSWQCWNKFWMHLKGFGSGSSKSLLWKPFALDNINE